jgi:hypothetical protein
LVRTVVPDQLRLNGKANGGIGRTETTAQIAGLGAMCAYSTLRSFLFDEGSLRRIEKGKDHGLSPRRAQTAKAIAEKS